MATNKIMIVPDVLHLAINNNKRITTTLLELHNSTNIDFLVEQQHW